MRVMPATEHAAASAQSRFAGRGCTTSSASVTILPRLGHYGITRLDVVHTQPDCQDLPGGLQARHERKLRLSLVFALRQEHIREVRRGSSHAHENLSGSGGGSRQVSQHHTGKVVGVLLHNERSALALHAICHLMLSHLAV